MRLTESSVAIRPRPAWEAIDLGVLLAREHRALLMGSWAVVTLPLFMLLTVTLWDYPSLAIFLFWWLKPAYERLPLLILSQALFGSTPTLKQALKAWPATLKNQLLPSLLWRRLSLSRSFHLPVQQLENLAGTERAFRLNLLNLKDAWAARLLTVVGAHLEGSLWVGLIILFYAFIPQQVEIDWQWMSLLDTEADWNWLEHLTNLFYALALVIWGPVYVACGFTLYLNRRTVLEAWDIELTFKRLRQRLSGSACALLLGLGLIGSIAPEPARADPQDFSCPAPDPSLSEAPETLPAPDTPRLTRQALTSESAQREITRLLQQPPFKNPRTVSGWRFPESPQEPQTAAAKGSQGAMFPWLTRLLQFARTLAGLFEVLLWAIVLGLSGLLIWRYRVWLKTFVGRNPLNVKKPGNNAPQQLFGLNVSANSLPDDIASRAEQLWVSSPRDAMSLLYRALLSRLLTDYGLPLKNADTEGQVLERIHQLNQPALSAFSHTLMAHWQNLAYGHRLPPSEAQQALCRDWRRLFSPQAKP